MLEDYKQLGNITLVNIVISGCQSSSGGAIFIEKLGYFFLENITAIGCSALHFGNFGIFLDLKSIEVTNILLLDNQGPTAQGTFYMENKNFNNFHRIKNLICYYNYAKLGSCLFLDSYDALNLTDISIEKCIGNSIKLTSWKDAEINLINFFAFNNQNMKDKFSDELSLFDFH